MIINTQKIKSYIQRELNDYNFKELYDIFEKLFEDYPSKID